MTTISTTTRDLLKLGEHVEKTGIAPTFTPDGDILYKPSKTTEKIISPQYYGLVSQQEIQDFYKQRRAELPPLQEAVIEAKKALREVMDLYKAGEASVANVVDANKAVQQAECMLNAKAKFPRAYEVLPTPYKQSYALLLRDLTFNVYDKDPPKEDILQAVYSTFTWRPMWKPVAFTKNEPVLVDTEDILEQDEEEEEEKIDLEGGGDQKPKRQLTAQQRAIIGYRMKQARGF